MGKDAYRLTQVPSPLINAGKRERFPQSKTASVGGDSEGTFVTEPASRPTWESESAPEPPASHERVEETPFERPEDAPAPSGRVHGIPAPRGHEHPAPSPESQVPIGTESGPRPVMSPAEVKRQNSGCFTCGLAVITVLILFALGMCASNFL